MARTGPSGGRSARADGTCTARPAGAAGPAGAERGRGGRRGAREAPHAGEGRRERALGSSGLHAVRAAQEQAQARRGAAQRRGLALCMHAMRWAPPRLQVSLVHGPAQRAQRGALGGVQRGALAQHPQHGLHITHGLVRQVDGCLLQEAKEGQEGRRGRRRLGGGWAAVGGGRRGGLLQASRPVLHSTALPSRAPPAVLTRSSSA